MLGIPFWGRNVVLVPLRVLSLKRSTTGAFLVPFKVLRQKQMAVDDVLF